jgi:hypothetical protein
MAPPEIIIGAEDKDAFAALFSGNDDGSGVGPMTGDGCNYGSDFVDYAVHPDDQVATLKILGEAGIPFVFLPEDFTGGPAPAITRLLRAQSETED